MTSSLGVSWSEIPGQTTRVSGGDARVRLVECPMCTEYDVCICDMYCVEQTARNDAFTVSVCLLYAMYFPSVMSADLLHALKR